MKVGDQIRRLRTLRNVSLTDLSRSSGVQIATLSRIENGKMTGTVESHMAIAKALGVDITEFYQHIQEPEVVPAVGPEAAEPIGTSDGKASQEILARLVTSKKMLPVLIKLEPGGATAQEKLPASAERFVYVLEGVIHVHLNTPPVRLMANTSLYLSAGQPHSFSNPEDKPARFICVTTPVTL